MMRRFMLWFFRPRKQWLWHPESPGVKVLVVRTWIGRSLKPREFATIYEHYWTDSPTLPPLHRAWHESPASQGQEGGHASVD